MTEETIPAAETPPSLVAADLIRDEARRAPDKPGVYRIDRFALTDRTSHGEIAEVGWFDPCALPQDVHRATVARLAEIYGDEDCELTW